MEHLDRLLSEVNKSLAVEVGTAVEMMCCEEVDALLNLHHDLYKFFGLVHDGGTLKLLRTLFLVLVMLLMPLNLVDYICEHRLLVKDYETSLLEVYCAGEDLTLAFLHLLNRLQVFKS